MPAYHSQFNSTEAKLVGNIPILPLKQSPNEEDIVDEAISLFKANTFFRNFDIKGGGDRLLIYLILYIQDCLLKLSKMPTRIEGDKMLATLAVSAFPLPGK